MFDSLLTGLLAGLLGPLMYLFLSLSLGLRRHWQQAAGAAAGLFQKPHHLVFEAGAVSLYRLHGPPPGVISGTADAAAVKVTKMAISGAVPVVGGMLSNATETVLAGAAAVRSTAGVLGLLAILAITAAPFLKLGAQYLLLKLTAALCGVVGSENHTALTENFAQAMGLLLATTGTCCLIQLISTVCFMKGVI